MTSLASRPLTRLFVIGLKCLTLLAGCSKDVPEDKEVTDVQLVDDGNQRQQLVRALMLDTLEPAADVIWDSAGYIITEEGEQELWPTTDEGWQRIVENTEIIQLASQNMQTAPYAAEERSWAVFSERLDRAAERVKLAAQNREKDELFEAGGNLYAICLACHQRFIIVTSEETGSD